MSWLSLVLVLAKLAQNISQWLAQKDLIDAGRAMAANEFLNRAIESLEYSRNVKTTYRNLSDANRKRLHAKYRRK